GNSLVYVEPLFVLAPQGRIPELQRVVLATQDRVVMAESFEKSLDQLFGSVAQPTPTPTPTPSPSPRPSPQPSPGPSASPAPAGSVADLVRSASQHYEQAQDALRRGDFAEYARLVKLLEDDLARLRAATGQCPELPRSGASRVMRCRSCRCRHPSRVCLPDSRDDGPHLACAGRRAVA